MEAGQVVGEALVASSGEDIGDIQAVGVIADFVRLADRTAYDRERFAMSGRLICRVMQALAEPKDRQRYVDEASGSAAAFIMEHVAPRYLTATFDDCTAEEKAASLTAANTQRVAGYLESAVLPAVNTGLGSLDIGSKVVGDVLYATMREYDAAGKPFHVRNIDYERTGLDALKARLWPGRHLRRQVAGKLKLNHAAWSTAQPDHLTGSPLAGAVHETMFAGAEQIAKTALFGLQIPDAALLADYRAQLKGEGGIMRVTRRASAVNMRKLHPITSIGGMLDFDDDGIMIFTPPRTRSDDEATQRSAGPYHFRENALVCSAATVTGALPAAVDMSLVAQYQTYERVSQILG